MGCTTMNNISINKSINLTQDYINQIVSEAREKFNIPAITVTAANSEKILIKSIQGTRIANTEDSATLDVFFISVHVRNRFYLS
jgi:hypothetical protein